MSSISVSVVAPLLRREGEAPAAIRSYLETTGFTFEIVAPEGDDYGQALRRGVSEARGGVIVIVDADVPYAVSAIGDAVAMVDSGTTDVVLGSTRSDYAGPALSRWLLAPMLPDPAIRLAAFSSVAAKVVIGETRLSGRGCELEIGYL